MEEIQKSDGRPGEFQKRAGGKSISRRHADTRNKKNQDGNNVKRWRKIERSENYHTDI